MELYQFTGDRNELNRLIGLKIVKVEHKETEASILDIDLVDENGNKHGLTFIDGAWYYGKDKETVLTINTHEKLMRLILEGEIDNVELFKRLQLHNFEGKQEQMSRLLLWAMNSTDAYTDSSQDVFNPNRHITEYEYFELLANTMNKCF